MTRLWLDCTGTEAEGTLTRANSVTLVGAGPILSDDSNATYADFYGGSSGQVACTFETPPVTVPPTKATAKAALLTTYTTATCPLLFISISGFGNVATWEPGDPIEVDADGWLVATFTVHNDAAFLGGSLGINNLGTAAVGQVYEAAVIFEWASVAPPCRLFPRGDGLGVGSGRHYPPPKSQQRSGRRFGYY